MLSHMAAAASADPVSPELALVDHALAARLRAVPDVLPTEALEPVTVNVGVDLDVGARPESPCPEQPLACDVHEPIADLMAHAPSAQPVEPARGLVEESRQTAGLNVGEREAQSVEPASMGTDERDPIADLIVHAPAGHGGEPGGTLTEEPSADLPVDDVSRKGDVSGYPSLPQPDAANLDALEAAELALKEIRDRLTEPAPRRQGARRFRKRFTVASGLSAAAALGVLAASAALGTATPYS
jgi:hypothetical protein